LLFALIQITIFSVVNVAPPQRLLSGLVWFGGLVLIFLTKNKIHYSRSIVTIIILITLGISSVSCLHSVFEDGIYSRPHAWFDEPSYAGLSFYAAAAGIFAVIYVLRLKLKFQILGLLLLSLYFVTAIATFSMHIISFLITLLLVILMRFQWRRLPAVTLLILLCTYSIASTLNLDHYFRRLNFGEDASSLSTLSWLRGVDQAVQSVNLSPVFGLGLGSTGYFQFDSVYSDTLSLFGHPNLNLTDAYSFFLRITIELGFPFAVALVLYICMLVLNLKKLIGDLSEHQSTLEYACFIFTSVFSLVLVIGILIKEPSYSRSFVYVAFLLLFTFSRSSTISRPRTAVPNNTVLTRSQP